VRLNNRTMHRVSGLLATHTDALNVLVSLGLDSARMRTLILLSTMSPRVGATHLVNPLVRTGSNPDRALAV